MKKQLFAVIAGVCPLVLGGVSARAQVEDWVPSTTFTNPTPQYLDRFGTAVASVGNGLVLIGSEEEYPGTRSVGAVYLYNLSGALLGTYTNPSPADSERFGRAVAGVGPDRVLIGAPLADIGTTNTGAAYLYDLTGSLLTLYTNPVPVSGGQFGLALAGVGLDKVVIGAPGDHGGTAHLYDLAGTRLATYTSPNPRNWSGFGTAVAGVGHDKVLIGSPFDSPGAFDAGAAYLYDLNGSLITTYTNPTPNGWLFGDGFGSTLAAVGTDKVLIGAYHDDLGGVNAGVVYLYDLEGTLLTTYTNPAPEWVPGCGGDEFGSALAAVGSNKVLIGAPFEDLGGQVAGVAYLYRLDGTLLFTYTAPSPEAHDIFGKSVASVGTDTVLIGAHGADLGAELAGAAFLYEWIPPSPVDLVQQLVIVVNDSDRLHKRPLLATLEAAWASIQRGHSIAAVNQLRAFENKVLSQVLRTDPDLALTLIEVAEEAIQAIEIGEVGN